MLYISIHSHEFPYNDVLMVGLSVGLFCVSGAATMHWKMTGCRNNWLWVRLDASESVLSQGRLPMGQSFPLIDQFFLDVPTYQQPSFDQDLHNQGPTLCCLFCWLSAAHKLAEEETTLAVPSFSVLAMWNPCLLPSGWYRDVILYFWM